MNLETLREAMREAASAEFAAVPAEESIEWTPSSYFRQRMEALVRREARFLWRPTGRRLLLVAALTALILMTFVTAGAFQKPVFHYFTEFFEDHFDITFGEKQPQDTNTFYGTFEPYTFTTLPDGYMEDSFEKFSDDFYETIWETPDGNLLILQQCFAGRADFSVDSEHGQVETIIVNDIEILVCTYETETLLFWSSEQYAFTLTVYDNLSIETLVEIIGSIELRK